MTTERKKRVYNWWTGQWEEEKPGTFLGRQWPWRSLFDRQRGITPSALPPMWITPEALEEIRRTGVFKQVIPPEKKVEAKTQPTLKRPPIQTPTNIENQIFDSAGWARYFQQNPDALGQMAMSLNLDSADVSGVVQGMRSQFENQKFQAAIARMQTEELSKQFAERQATSDWLRENYLAAAKGGAFVESKGKRIERARAANEIAFEDWRGRLLEQLTGPANEVERWFVQRKPNPYLRYNAEEEQNERDISGRAREIARTQGMGAVPEWLLKYVEEPGPPTPEWLPQFAPETRAGKPLSKLGTVPTPSGQQLNRMLSSQAAWLSGTLNYFGGRPWGDILSEAEVMQPQNPGGGARWRPVSQF